MLKRKKWKRENESWVGSRGEGSGETETPARRPCRNWGGSPGEMQTRQDREHSGVFIRGSSHTLSAVSKGSSLLASLYSMMGFYLQKTTCGVAFTQLS